MKGPVCLSFVELNERLNTYTELNQRVQLRRKKETAFFGPVE